MSVGHGGVANRTRGLPGSRFVGLTTRARLTRDVASALYRTGVVRPTRPDRLVGAGRALRRFGPTLAGGYEAAAVLYPDRLAVITDTGSTTFAELSQRTDGLVPHFVERGIGARSRVAVMCRNGKWFVEASVAASKLGADLLFLNTGFAAPQLADVLRRERADALVHDEEFTAIAERAAPAELPRFSEGLPTVPTQRDPDASSAPIPHGRMTLLTSGTTGTPKGAQRGEVSSMTPLAGLLSKIPLRAGATTVIAPPLFHAWGLLNWMLAMSLGSPIVLRHHFDPEQALAAVAEHRADTLVVVPVMLQRIVDLPEATRKRYDISTLRVIASSGSQLTAGLATRAREIFGDVVYNLYGSTEVAWATIATPEDLREAPGTAGRAPMGTTVRIYDDHDRPVSRSGEVGRIFVGNELAFEGYTGGGNKARIDGLLATGDVGCFDEDGRLFVRGRDDDMIVSGGENVFPQEVEDVLAGHRGVDDVAVFGVDDPEFGQRLVAVVVRRAGNDALTAGELQSFVRQHLAGYKAPRDVFFVEELPRNATGKVMKGDLKATFA